jgi:acyl-coenzyme A synthetase/AMP-(fatty) acid ligase
VREAVVMGVADASRGQHLAARVVLREGQSARPEELHALCTADLLPYKVPRSIRIVDELPRSPTGKPLRRAPG